MNPNRSFSPIAIEIALLRAKHVARRCMKRAVELLLGVGVAFEKAARFVAMHACPAA